MLLVLYLFIVLFFFDLWDLFINIISFIFPDILNYDYCDSLENNNDLNNEQDNEIRDENNIEEIGVGREENIILLSFKDKIRRRFQWYSREQFKDKYSTYKEFKDTWKPEKKLRKGIRDDIKSVQNNIQEKIEKIRYQNLYYHNIYIQ